VACQRQRGGGGLPRCREKLQEKGRSFGNSGPISGEEREGVATGPRVGVGKPAVPSVHPVHVSPLSWGHCQMGLGWSSKPTRVDIFLRATLFISLAC
jgi:hypothetical protein